jgi:hypothetical protein
MFTMERFMDRLDNAGDDGLARKASLRGGKIKQTLWCQQKVRMYQVTNEIDVYLSVAFQHRFCF